MTDAIISSFRRSLHNYKPRQFILVIDGVDDKEKAKEFIGKTVEWVSSGKNPKIIHGKITKLHGKSHLRALFERGLPGQALGHKVKILDQIKSKSK